MGYFLLWIISWLVIGVCLYRLVGKESLVIGIGGGFIGSLLFLILVFTIWPLQSEQEKAAAEAAKAVSSVEDACRDDWHRCTDNAMLVNKSQIYYQAVVACKEQADKQARYGHPDFPFLAFGHFYQGNSYLKSGVLILGEPDASFQNGFGAMARMTVTCWYDMNKQVVVDMEVEQH